MPPCSDCDQRGNLLKNCTKTVPITSRKKDHIKICLRKDVQFKKSHGFDRYHLKHAPLPEVNLSDIDTGCTFFQKPFSLPLFIEAMTGGTPESFNINKHLAIAAQKCGIGMGVGSQRVMLNTREFDYTYQIRKYAPDIFLVGNIGASQLKEFTASQIERAVTSIEADALAIHLNAVQEICQPEGDTDWSGILSRIKDVAGKMKLPVIIKETGSGLTADLVRTLESAGIKGIDIGGAGGTSWAKVEYFRGSRVAAPFLEWGLPTADSLVECAGAIDLPIIASGGIRTGKDIVKALALGAQMAGMALPFLRPAMASAEAVIETIEKLKGELIRTLFLTGISDVGSINRELIRQAPQPPVDFL